MGISGRSTSASAVGKSVAGVTDRATGVLATLLSLLVLGMLVVAGLVIGWQRWGRSVVARPVYRIAAENIRLTPAPTWIRTDVRGEVVREGALDDLSIFDKDVTIRVYQAFELHPWVRKVRRVSKHPPARLEVDLEYREPVAWVEVPRGVLPGTDGGVIPVDAGSVVLPSRDFTSDHVGDYLRITIPDVTPCGLAGTPWGDVRVAGAAEIAALLAPRWRDWHLFRIRLADGHSDPGSRHLRYELETAGQRRIIWGQPPGAENFGEPTAAAKLLRLQRLFASAGDLDAQPSDTVWDLRQASAG